MRAFSTQETDVILKAAEAFTRVAAKLEVIFDDLIEERNKEKERKRLQEASNRARG